MTFGVGSFSIVPEELLGVAIRFGDYVEREGYVVSVEPFELAQPSTPVFRVARGLTTKFVHISSKPDVDELLDWAQYARTFSVDTRVAIALPDSAVMSMEVMGRLGQAQVGVVLVSRDSVQVVAAAADLTVNLALPRLPPGTQVYLGDAWDLIRSGNWMEGFEEACQVLNTLAAGHLSKKLQGGTISFVAPPGNRARPTVAQVERATLGTLGGYYSLVAKPGRVETTVEGVIKEINENRITVSHFKRDPSRQSELRDNVARHTFMVLNAVKLLV